MLKGYEVTGDAKLRLKGILAEREIRVYLFRLSGRQVTFLLEEGEVQEAISFIGDTPLLPHKYSLKKFWEERVVSVEFWPGTGTVYLHTRNIERWYFGTITDYHFRTPPEEA